MFKRNYEARRANGKRKLSSAALIALLLALLTIGGTIAFIATRTDEVENTFAPAITDIEIREDFNSVTKENVKVKSNCEYPAYIRATYVAYWVSDEDGSVLAEAPTLIESINETDWTYRAEDGYWYYKQILPVDGETSNFINSISADGEKEGYHLVIDIISESVQASPEGAVKDVWGFKPTTVG